jgi:F420-dependent oxidoreductase-like protein
MRPMPPEAPLRLPVPCVVVLVGPSGSGKSTWAAANFAAGQIVSSDRLRALVGEGEDDQRASEDAFDLLDTALAARVRRRLTTVVDTLGFEAPVRERCRRLAADAGLPCNASAFDASAAECRARNRGRERRVGERVLTAQFRLWSELLPHLADEGFSAVLAPADVELVPAELFAELAAGRDGPERPALRFGLQVNAFGGEGGAAALAARLQSIARAAEAAGFDSLWVMDHLRQIPQVGPAWADLPECFTTRGFLAAVTERVRLGPLVAGVTYRNVAQLGKMVATLDVLSGGRVTCGIGLAWFETEHRAYGLPFPPRRERYALLEDALQFLPKLWGKGSPSFEGRVLHVPEALCYPRPLQEKVPILVGGSGERRTLRLVARYADACNLFGDAATVARKVSALRAHCATIDREPAEIEVTHLGDVLVGRDRSEVDRLVEAHRPRRVSAERFAARVRAGTVEQHAARFQALAAAGVSHAIVSLADLDGPGPVERFGAVIDRFTAP